MSTVSGYNTWQKVFQVHDILLTVCSIFSGEDLPFTNCDCVIYAHQQTEQNAKCYAGHLGPHHFKTSFALVFQKFTAFLRRVSGAFLMARTRSIETHCVLPCFKR